MGTPGDKFPISKVVHGEQSASPQQEVQEPEQLTSAHEMTILQNIPALGIYIEHDIEHAEPSTISAPTLEDLEKQLFFDLTPSASTSAAASGTIVDDTLLSLPGPSGLQTPKTKPVKVLPKRNRKQPPISSQTPKKPYTCPICEKNFQTSAKLTSHQLVHSGGTPYKCEHCKKSFSSKFKLVRHVLIHSDRKPFSCTVCERTFHRKDHLKNHIKVHSPCKKVYTCERTECKKEYTSVMSYRKHLALHSAEEGGLECKICSKVFETKPEILYHLKIHAGSRTVKNPNEKKFTCDHCDRKFFTRKDVRRHLVVHTGTRNFLCQFCPQRFGRKDHLVRHIKKSHTKSKPEVKSEETQSLELDEMRSDVQGLLFTQLSPMLSSGGAGAGGTEQELTQFITTEEESSDLLSELDVMKEELVLPDIDTDLFRLMGGEGGASTSQADNNTLPLPGFSQVFKQQEPPPPS